MDVHVHVHNVNRVAVHTYMYMYLHVHVRILCIHVHNVNRVAVHTYMCVYHGCIIIHVRTLYMCVICKCFWNGRSSVPVPIGDKKQNPCSLKVKRAWDREPDIALGSPAGKLNGISSISLAQGVVCGLPEWDIALPQTIASYPVERTCNPHWLRVMAQPLCNVLLQLWLNWTP